MEAGLPLEPTGADVRALTEEALTFLVAFTEGRSVAPAASFERMEELLTRVRQPAPEAERPLAELMDTISAATAVGHDTTGDGWLAYGTGALLVRDGEKLRAAHEIHDTVLRDLTPEGGLPNFADYSPELSRDARGLRLWMPIMLHGLGAFRDALDEKLDLARHVFDELRTIPSLQLPWEPELSTVGFRHTHDHGSEGDAATAALLERINESGRVFLSSTMAGGRMTIRVCVLSVHSHRDRIDELIHIIRQSIAAHR